MSLWNELKKQYRYMDGIIIGLLIILSFVPMVVFAYTTNDKDYTDGQTEAIITINGKEVDRFTLSKDTPHQEKTYHPTDKQYNIIEVDGTRIRVREDNSPDQIAVKTGWIEKPGQVSICLPHKLMIEIKGVINEEDEMIISY
ncbi:NusG domain II-containing protein [Vagococcus xieshaowenii]|uniref:NusG domain II-containing protein n=1 Tax=Vagococcus xieshaowenii TaxID=2562451 RepID=A0AAJ5JKX4_9ENTE|nr:NusG domain II-containing protein [Vagococcus xieshaowenii]QCA27867.1 NusG domain II-containing protein [Vagococcus xieshaowenii]TFZ39453.1 NusG domain II-containing protein [Vagococcus xieshaowenii]